MKHNEFLTQYTIMQSKDFHAIAEMRSTISRNWHPDIVRRKLVMVAGNTLRKKFQMRKPVAYLSICHVGCLD